MSDASRPARPSGRPPRRGPGGPLTRLRRAALGAAAVVLSLTACAAEAAPADVVIAEPSASVVPPVRADAALGARLPADLRAGGVLVVGTDPTYAPNEFLAADGTTVTGFDVELFDAVAAKLGLRTRWQPARFSDIIPGVASGRFAVGVSSVTVSPERIRQATMVSYYAAGTLWAGPPDRALSPDDACGRRVAVQAGTVQAEDVRARSKRCEIAGKPAVIVTEYEGQGEVTDAVLAGRDDAMLADSPVCAYAVKQTGGRLTPLGDVYDAAPYGYVLPRGRAAFAELLRDAVRALIADGTYRAILTKWGVESGAIQQPAVNPMVAPPGDR